MDTVSLSDIAAVTRGNDNDGWGNGGAWWIIILFLFVFMGGGFWGNRKDAKSPNAKMAAYYFGIVDVE